MIKKDLQAVQVGDDWYNVAQDRGKWRSAWRLNLIKHQEAQQRGRLRGERNVLCDVCGRRFGRKGDKARHKCAAERSRPVSEQERAAQCEVSRSVQHSVKCAGGGSAAEGVWRSIGATERRLRSVVQLEALVFPRGVLNVGCAAELSTGGMTSRDTSAVMNAANQCRNSGVLSNVRFARDGLRVQAV